MPTSNYSDDCLRALAALRKRKSVLVCGATATGKTALLQEVQEAFLDKACFAPGSTAPNLNLKASLPIAPGTNGVPGDVWPSPGKPDRKVFATTFHQAYTQRDFLNGMQPDVSKPGNFMVVHGKLFDAAEHARTTRGASLLIIDELNRGPAMHIFGGAIAAIEADKRIPADGNLARAAHFEVMDPVTGGRLDYALPEDLYVLGAMSQAVAPVGPLNADFLRHWTLIQLRPDARKAREILQVTARGSLPDEATEPDHVLEALIRAWSVVNRRIRLDIGPEFELGHGVLCRVRKGTLAETIEDAVEVWDRIYQHIAALYVGDAEKLGRVVNASTRKGAPFHLRQIEYADEIRTVLDPPETVDASNIYAVLKAVAVEDGTTADSQSAPRTPLSRRGSD